MADEFCLKMPDFHVTFRDLLHAVNLRHGTNGFTSLPKEVFGRVWTRELGYQRPHATSRQPKSLIEHAYQYTIFFETIYLRLTEGVLLFTKEFYKIIYQEPHPYTHKLTSLLKICGSSVNFRRAYFEQQLLLPLGEIQILVACRLHGKVSLFPSFFFSSWRWTTSLTLNSRGRLFMLLTSTARSLNWLMTHRTWHELSETSCV